MKEFLSTLINPIPLFFLLLSAGFFLLCRGRRRAGRILLLAAGCWVLGISTRPLPYWLVNSLERRYNVFEYDSLIIPDSKLHIMVLAAGHADDPALQPNNQLSLQGLGRLTEGVRIYKLYPGAKMVLSGPGGLPGLKQWEVLRRTSIMMGVDSLDIIPIDSAKNTTEEARLYSKHFGTGEKFILVTSAIHMPRAMYIFRQAGLDPIPAPTNHIIKHGSKKGTFGWLPAGGNVVIMEGAMHEYGGMIWHRAQGAGHRGEKKK